MALAKEKISDFIQKWEEKTCLWKVTSPEHKNRNERTKAIEELSETFDISGKIFYIEIVISSENI